MQILQELEEKGIKGEILTTNYLSFSEPEALKTLNALSNITLKMYDVDKSGEGFHTKGYIFRKAEIYRIIIGSSNITKTALTTNREWNTRIVSTSQGEMSKSVVDEFYELWNSKYALDFDEFYENYKKRYELIKKQRKLARSEEITSIEKYRLQPNSMQIVLDINECCFLFTEDRSQSRRWNLIRKYLTKVFLWEWLPGNIRIIMRIIFLQRSRH